MILLSRFECWLVCRFLCSRRDAEAIQMDSVKSNGDSAAQLDMRNLNIRCPLRSFSGYFQESVAQRRESLEIQETSVQSQKERRFLFS